MSPPTDEDLELFPHVILTSEGDWDPTVLDNEITLGEVPQVLTNLPPANMVISSLMHMVTIVVSTQDPISPILLLIPLMGSPFGASLMILMIMLMPVLPLFASTSP